MGSNLREDLNALSGWDGLGSGELLDESYQDSTFETDDLDLPSFDDEDYSEAVRLTRRDARWAAPALSPDHRHLLPLGASTHTFSFTPAHLQRLCTLNRFRLPREHTRVLFALRACTLPGAANSTGWASSVRLVEASPDHSHARCILGVWDRPGRRLSVFKGSTVPFWRSMENFRQGGAACNLLSTGLYQYRVGTHRSGHRLEIQGALRQQGPVVVLRTLDDLIYTVNDRWDSGHVGDNIHPARHLSTSPFSSEGCQTIPGTYNRTTGVHRGEWTNFRRAAGLTPDRAPRTENGRRFSFVLLTGREARLIGSVSNPNTLMRLRFGSSGTAVRELQNGLRSAGFYRGASNGNMDVPTTRAYIRWQKSVDSGQADAIVTPAAGRALGLDMIRRMCIRPVPWRPPWSPSSDLLRPAAPSRSALAPRAPRTRQQPRFRLGASVGRDGTNASADVAALRARLRALGYNWLTAGDQIDDLTIRTIQLFQSIVAGRNSLSGDGRVDVPGETLRWLQAVNAPRWQTMPAGSAAAGFDNVELRDRSDHHDYGTDWLANVIRAAGGHYRDHYRNTHAGAALLTVNDVSLPHGGDTPDHAGHETGLACDLRLPRTDGTAPGATTYTHAQYDRNAARAMLQALRAQPQMSQIFFNDPTLIGERLCTRARGHDNHIHFQISPPHRGAVEV